MVPNHNFYKKNAQSAKKASNMSSSVLDECRDKNACIFGMTYCIKCQEAFVQKFGT